MPDRVGVFFGYSVCCCECFVLWMHQSLSESVNRFKMNRDVVFVKYPSFSGVLVNNRMTMLLHFFSALVLPSTWITAHFNRSSDVFFSCCRG